MHFPDIIGIELITNYLNFSQVGKTYQGVIFLASVSFIGLLIYFLNKKF